MKRCLLIKILVPLIAFLPAMNAFAQEARTETLSVFVTIPPQKYLAERIAGETAEVTTLMGPTGSPETFEPAPGDIEALIKADMYLPLGIRAEEKWLSVVTDRNRPLRIAECCRQLMTYVDEHEYRDPHIWTDPVLSLHMAGIIRDALSDLRPTSGPLYERHYRELAAEISVLDNFLHELFSSVPGKSFVVSHPAWSYFARRYGLKQIVLEHEGREIGPRTMSEKIRQARAGSINTVFIQQQHNSAAAKRLAEEIGARIVFLNPMKEDHLNNIRETALLIAASMK